MYGCVFTRRDGCPSTCVVWTRLRPRYAHYDAPSEVRLRIRDTGGSFVFFDWSPFSLRSVTSWWFRMRFPSIVARVVSDLFTLRASAPAIFARARFVSVFAFNVLPLTYTVCITSANSYTHSFRSCVRVCGRARSLYWRANTRALMRRPARCTCWRTRAFSIISLRGWSRSLRCPGRHINSLIIIRYFV